MTLRIKPPPHPDEGFHLTLLILLAAVFVWSGWDMTQQRNVWTFHALPVGVAALMVIAIYPFFQFSKRTYAAIWGFLAMLLAGAHYGVNHVPGFEQVQNGGWYPHGFDRTVHFLQGLIPAMALGEILDGCGVVRSRGWRAFLVISCTLAISAGYEIFEWLVASSVETRPTDFVTDTNTWDTQWDMAMALIGAIAAPLLWKRQSQLE